MIRSYRDRRTRRRAAQRVRALAAQRQLLSAADAAPVLEEEGGTEGLPFELADESMMEMTENAHPTKPSSQPAQDEPEALAATPEDRAEPAQEPDAEEVLYRAARQATAQGDGRRAQMVYRELLERNPTNVKARNNLALLLDQSGEHEVALEELDRCVQLEPDNPHVLVNRGAVLGSLARFTEAERDLRHVLRVDPTNAEAQFNLGLVISRKGLWRDAVPYLRRAIELDSSRAAAYQYLGEALNHVDDLDGALRSYQRALELRPNSPRLYYGMGIVLDRLNRPEDAAQMYRRSRELAGQ